MISTSDHPSFNTVSLQIWFLRAYVCLCLRVCMCVRCVARDYSPRLPIFVLTTITAVSALAV